LAFDALVRGPASTADLAAQVLHLSGNPKAVRAAVHALLSADERFEVDERGVWSLASEAERPGPDLRHVAFAVVDVETTGGPLCEGHRMTDLAIVRVEGGCVVREWSTLLNPGRSIPVTVERLTGIQDAMVVGAPYFEEVADQVAAELEGCVFVAHNAGFDWGFVRGQLADAGTPMPSMRRLCTVRMARRLVPELRRRNLDALADHFDIPVFDRHRAHGDAMATARVLIRLMDVARGRGLREMRTLERYVNRSPKRGRRRSGRRPRA